jgi:hypothetical protein
VIVREDDPRSKQVELSLDQVAQRLDGAGVPWVLFAGAAAKVYGADRPLTDIDILVPAAKESRLVALFPEARAHRHEDGALALILPGFDILAGLGVLDLDLAMQARVAHGQIEGVTLPVIPREDNILLKARLGRGADVGKHDWEDVAAMVSSADELDWDYLHWRAGQMLDPKRAAEILGQLEMLGRIGSAAADPDE